MKKNNSKKTAFDQFNDSIIECPEAIKGGIIIIEDLISG